MTTETTTLPARFPRTETWPPGWDKYRTACDAYVAEHRYGTSTADVEIGVMGEMAAIMVESVRKLQALNGRLEDAANPRWDAHSIVGQWVDSLDLGNGASRVLEATVERRIPAPRRVTVG